MRPILILILAITISLHGTQTLEINYNPVDISSYDKQELFSYNMSKLVMYIYLNNMSCVVSQPQCTTNHAYVSVDIYSTQGIILQRSEDYMAFGLFWESLDHGNRWGGHKRQANVHRFEAKL